MDEVITGRNVNAVTQKEGIQNGRKSSEEEEEGMITGCRFVVVRSQSRVLPLLRCAHASHCETEERRGSEE